MLTGSDQVRERGQHDLADARGHKSYKTSTLDHDKISAQLPHAHGGNYKDLVDAHAGKAADSV